jgi:hypothetical protein
MTTVGQLKDRCTRLYDRINTLRSNIVTSLSDTSQLKTQVVAKAKQELKTLKKDQDVYDAQFTEEEMLSQAMGGKTRQQTLQEFVLLFFFVAYGVLTISLTLAAYRDAGGASAVKMIVLMSLMSLVVAAFIIRYG